MTLRFPESLPTGDPALDYDAYIFDCDGTLADTMPLHYRAWQAALAPYGCPFPEPFFYEMGGVPTERIVEILNAREGLSMPVRPLALEKERLYIGLVPQAAPIPEVVAFVRQVRGKKPMAVASGGHRRIVAEALRAIGLEGVFDAIVGAEDYANGKPAPDPFLEAARRLGVDPRRCLAFEDTALGIQSATDAGMQTVLVPSGPGCP